MTTLSGFEDHHRTPEAWRDYIERLSARIEAQEAEITRLRTLGRSHNHRRWDLMCRMAVYDHRLRALAELRRIDGR